LEFVNEKIRGPEKTFANYVRRCAERPSFSKAFGEEHADALKNVVGANQQKKGFPF